MEFDEYQQRAITTTTGPVMVIAGPGAGKTAVLVAKIQHLITVQSIAPEHILAITFTRKAAEEIAERLQQPAVTVCTIHALALQLLQEHQPDYQVIDDQFDQLLLNVEPLLPRYQGRWRYLLIDEYQDTDPVQVRIIQQLALPGNNLCVIGDPDQAIYGFRGVNPMTMLNFAGNRIDLVNQYRSSATIVSAANALIRHNQQRLDHTIIPTQPNREKIQVWSFASPLQEAYWVVETIQQLLGGTDMLTGHHGNGFTFEDVAVIYRLNSIGDQFEKVMAESGLPYYRIGNDDTPPEYWHPQRETISLLTAHAAKGLELSVVFIIGAEEGIFPYTQKEEVDMEEERRLFYVACTRAKERLYITHANKRMVFGKTEQRPVSRFVGELGQAGVEYYQPDAKPKKPKQEQLL